MPIAWETLVDYWAGEIEDAVALQLEEHLMGCEVCTRASGRVAVLTETLRAMIPPVITHSALDRLRAQGRSIQDNPMQPGERREVAFPRGSDLLIHRLAGLELSAAARVSFVLRSESTGRVIIAADEVPFDRDTRELLLACQAHYSSMPPDTVAEVRVHDRSGSTTVSSYKILHLAR
jgi:hypothetical protein